MYKVYGDLLSGNCYKIMLCLKQLDFAFEWQDIDILKNESRSTQFLRKNPNGKIPVLEIDGTHQLAESNAILYYLAADTRLFPQQRLLQASALQWMFFEQYSHEPYIATARFIVKYLGSPLHQQQQLQAKREPGYAALDVMEQHLKDHAYFAGDYSIADIALYAYTHIAHEGGFELSAYSAIHDWLQRVRQQPGHVAMQAPS